jgi:hypothetical protein
MNHASPRIRLYTSAVYPLITVKCITLGFPLEPFHEPWVSLEMFILLWKWRHQNRIDGIVIR